MSAVLWKLELCLTDFPLKQSVCGVLGIRESDILFTFFFMETDYQYAFYFSV